MFGQRGYHIAAALCAGAAMFLGGLFPMPECPAPGPALQPYQAVPIAKLSENTGENIPENISKDWYSRIRKQLAAEEYHIAYQPELAAYSSPNRAQNLQVRYAADGFSLEPRAGSGAGWQLDLDLEGIGRAADELLPEPIGDPQGDSRICVAGERMSFQHDGFRVEYRNDRNGMRQDFIVERPPSGDGPLKVNLRAAGGLRPVVQGEDDIVFIDGEAEQVVWYKGLKAWDASGRELPAHMQADDNRIALVVDDTRAEYPVTVDPLSSTYQWRGLGNEEDASYGWSVAGAGDVNGDGYDDVIVGGYDYLRGAAFVYHGSDTGLADRAAWQTDGVNGFSYYGWSVCGAGDVNNDGYDDVIVGAPRDFNGQNQEGRAFLYLGSASGLSRTAAWIGESNRSNAEYGTSVSNAGDVDNDGYDDVIVGAPYYTTANGYEGRAYLYRGGSAGLSATPAWTVDGGSARYLGNSVSSAGDVNRDHYDDVIVGAPGYTNSQQSQGRALVYYGSASGLSATPAWTMDGTIVNGGYGKGVTDAGDVNGDGYDDVAVASQRDADYIYYGSATGLARVPAWVSGDREGGSACESAGDINGDGYGDVVFTSQSFQVSGGSTRLYYGSPDGLSATAVWSSGTGAADCAGDVNGDGYDDLIVGAYEATVRYYNEGAAFVYHGGPDSTAVRRILSGVVVDDAGSPVAGASVMLDGDVTVTTGSGGTFQFSRPLSVGYHRLTVSASGFQTTMPDLIMPDADKHVVIGLGAEAPLPQGPFTLCGVVTRVDGNGAVLAGASVEMMASGTVVGTTSTDAQGRFCSSSFPSGRYQVRFSRAGYQTLTADLLLDANKQVVISLTPSSLE